MAVAHEPPPADPHPPPGSAPGGARLWWLLAALLAALVLAMLLLDWNLLRGVLARQVEARTGRATEIGHLDVRYGWVPTVVLEQVRFGNPDWSEHARMFEADRVEASVRPWPLLTGRLVLPRLSVERGRLLLERDAEDRANWEFGSDGDGRGVAVGMLEVEHSALRILEAGHDTDLELEVHTAPADRNGAAPLVLEGEGTYRGRAFSLEGRVDSPLALQDGGSAYHLDLAARAGATRATARGALTPPLDSARFSVQATLAGDDLAELHPLLGLSMPPTPPYALEGRLARDGSTWTFEAFSGRVGDSDLSGDVTVQTAGERPHLSGALRSGRLDFDDLGTTVGAAPGVGEDETASAQQQRLAEQRAASPRVLPDQPFRVDAMRAMDADVSLTAARIESRLPLTGMAVDIHLEEGVLRLDPLAFDAAGGRIEGSVRLDASQDPIAATADVRLRGLDLGRLFEGHALAEDTTASIGGQIELSGRGNHVAAMLATADGQVAAVMGRGRMSNLLLEMAGLDIAEVLGFLLTEDRTVPVHCAYAAFDVRDGIMHTRTMALDTTDTVIFGEGSIDLGRERLQLSLKPRPKDRSIAALRVPLEVTGSFRDPDIAPKGGPLALRALAAAALYAIAPPAALLALVETGPGERTGCNPAESNRTAQDMGEQRAEED